MTYHCQSKGTAADSRRPITVNALKSLSDYVNVNVNVNVDVNVDVCSLARAECELGRHWHTCSPAETAGTRSGAGHE